MNERCAFCEQTATQKIVLGHVAVKPEDQEKLIPGMMNALPVCDEHEDAGYEVHDALDALYHERWMDELYGGDP